MDPFENVTKHPMGFYQLKDLPGETELEEYYANKYYQQSHSLYEKSYSEEELLFFQNRLARKAHVLNTHLELENKRFLDIGCGEGWALQYFNERGWEVSGLDYSSSGIEHINADMKVFHKSGNLHELIKEEKEEYSFALLDNVLEHVLQPESILKDVHNCLEKKGLLMIEVPNDFSSIQLKLLEEGALDRPTWIFNPDHISYFSLESLKKLLASQSFSFVDAYTDFPIDFFLANENTNYYSRPDTGKSVHRSRLLIENLMDDISTEKSVAMYREMINLDFGRNIVALFRK